MGSQPLQGIPLIARAAIAFPAHLQAIPLIERGREAFMSRRRQKPLSRGGKLRPDSQSTDDVGALRQALAAAEERLRQVEAEGADAYMKRRMAEMDEARLVARGQALEAAAARAKAEAERRALSDVIDKATGIEGWLMRRARRRAGL